MKRPVAHRVTGLHRLFQGASPYSLYQWLVGAPRVRRALATEYLRCPPECRVLDLGCGPAQILDLLPAGVAYTGLDLNPRYLGAAQRHYGHRGRWLLARAGELPDADLGGPFDRILVAGLLHHLDPPSARMVLDQCRRVLAAGGLLVTIDPVRLPSPSRVARWLIDHDRGARVRTADGYLALLYDTFPEVQWEVRSDLLRVPFSHFLARCSIEVGPLSRT